MIVQSTLLSAVNTLLGGAMFVSTSMLNEITMFRVYIAPAQFAVCRFHSFNAIFFWSRFKPIWN